MTIIDIGNRLSGSISPYLLQHKDNPVHWLPWGEEAFRLAQELDRPILLSIGYAACHWCHVMAHESFEDPDIARVMNAHYINVKVDREERPDVDRLYMQALHMLGEQGGWPLTMFLTPDGTPIWGGTYFPPEPRYGRPGFRQVLEEIARLWQHDREKLLKNARALSQALAQREHVEPATVSLPDDLPRKVSQALIRHFDPEKGGIGGAPKFPQCPALNLLLHAGGTQAQQHVVNTLRHICQGGIYDHLGGGFARYSTDELWLVPHFEKMLYDNALLVSTLAIAWLQTGDELFRLRIAETIDFMERELHIEGAGYAASLDADSEGEEGKFYVWSYDEIHGIVSPEHFELFARAYDITPGGNWEGRIILNRRHQPMLMDDEHERILARERRRLFEARERRVRPARDDKVLASWNGLAISAIAQAGLALDNEDWLQLAQTRYREVWNTLFVDGELRQSWNRHLLPTPATADGVANMMRAALDLYQATAATDYLEDALDLLRLLHDHYIADSKDAFCFTHDSVRDIPLRQVHGEDEATPSYQGTLAENLLHLTHITGDTRHADMAERIFLRFARDMVENPLAHASLLKAFWLSRSGVKAVLAHGEDSRETLRLLATFVRQLTLLPPVAHLLPDQPLRDLPPHLQAAACAEERPALIACRGQTCAMPVHRKEDIPAALELIWRMA